MSHGSQSRPCASVPSTMKTKSKTRMPSRQQEWHERGTARGEKVRKSESEVSAMSKEKATAKRGTGASSESAGHSRYPRLSPRRRAMSTATGTSPDDNTTTTSSFTISKMKNRDFAVSTSSLERQCQLRSSNTNPQRNRHCTALATESLLSPSRTAASSRRVNSAGPSSLVSSPFTMRPFTPPSSPEVATGSCLKHSLDALSPASYARQRRSLAHTISMTGERRLGNNKNEFPRKSMARRATIPLMLLPSMQRRRSLNGSNDDVSNRSRTRKTIKSTAATVTPTNITFSDVTPTSNGLLQHTVTTAASGHADDVLNGSLVPRRSNTMATLPTQLQQQRRQHNSTRLSPSSPTPSHHTKSSQPSRLSLSKARVATAGAPSPSTSVLLFGNPARTNIAPRRSSTAQSEKTVVGSAAVEGSEKNSKRAIREFQLTEDAASERRSNSAPEDAIQGDAEAFCTQTGDSVIFLGSSGQTCQNSKTLPPPLLFLTPTTSTVTSPAGGDAAVSRLSRLRRGSITMASNFIGSPTSLDHPAHRGLTAEMDPIVTGEGTDELNVLDAPHYSSTSTTNGSLSSMQHHRASFCRTSRRTSTAGLSRKARFTTKGRVSPTKAVGAANCDEGERDVEDYGGGERLRVENSEASPGTSTTSTSVLLHVSFDGFADTLSAGPSLVSSTSLSSLTQVTPMSTKKSEKRAAAAAGTVEIAFSGFSQTQRSSVVGFPLLPLASVLPESSGTSPSAKSGKRRSSSENTNNNNNTNHSCSSASRSSPSRAQPFGEAQQQGRLLHASAYALLSTSSGPLRSASTENVASPAAQLQQQQHQQQIFPPLVSSLTQLLQKQQQMLEASVAAETRYPSLSEDSIGSPSRSSQGALQRGNRGNGYQAIETSETVLSTLRKMPAKPAQLNPSFETNKQSSLVSPLSNRHYGDNELVVSTVTHAGSHASSSTSAFSDAQFSAGVLTPLPDSTLQQAESTYNGDQQRQQQQHQQQSSPAFLMPLMQFASRDSTPMQRPLNLTTTTASSPPLSRAPITTTNITKAADSPHEPTPPAHLNLGRGSAAWRRSNSTTTQDTHPAIPSPPRWPTWAPSPQQQQQQQQPHRLNSASLNTSNGADAEEASSSDSLIAAAGMAVPKNSGEQAHEEKASYAAFTMASVMGPVPQNPSRVLVSPELPVVDHLHELSELSVRSSDQQQQQQQGSSISFHGSLRDFISGREADTQRADHPTEGNNSNHLYKSVPASTLPRRLSNNMNNGGGGDRRSPIPFHSVAGLSGGANPLPRPGEPSVRSTIISTPTAIRMTTPRNNSSIKTTITTTSASCSISTPPASGMNLSGQRTTTASTVPGANATNTPMMSFNRASPIFTGFGFAARTASNLASASLSLPAHARSSSGVFNIPPTVHTQPLVATSQLTMHPSMGSVSTTSSLGAFVLQNSNTALMLRRGLPHKLTEVPLPDPSGGSTAGLEEDEDDESGLLGSEDNVNRDEDLMTSAMHRANQLALQLPRRGMTGGVKSGNYSRHVRKDGGTRGGGHHGAGSRRRRSLLKPGTAIELAIQNGLYTRRTSAISLLYNNKGDGAANAGGWSVLGRRFSHSVCGQQSWGDSESMEVSLSCAASFIASSTTAVESYISSSFGSLSQAVIKYHAKSTSSNWVESKDGGTRKANNSNNRSSSNNVSIQPFSQGNTSRTVVLSSSLTFPPVKDKDSSEGKEERRDDEAAASDVPCVLYTTAPRHYHFYRTKLLEDVQQQQQEFSSPLQLPRCQQQQGPSSSSRWTDAAAATPTLTQLRQREKRHHRYVRVHHRQRKDTTSAVLRENLRNSPAPDVEYNLITVSADKHGTRRERDEGLPMMQVESSLLREPTAEEARKTAQDQAISTANDTTSLPANLDTDMVHTSASPPTRSQAQLSSPDRAIYSPHLSTSSLLYYDDVDSDAVDDVYYQLEKRLFPVKAEQELQRQMSLPTAPKPLQELRGLTNCAAANNINDKGDADTEMDALFTVLEVPLRLNLRGGFHLSDYYAPCPVCHPVMRKLSAAAVRASTSTTSSDGSDGSTTDDVMDVRSGDKGNFRHSVCSCLFASNSTSSSCSTYDANKDGDASRSSDCSSLVSSVSTSSAYTASSPSAVSVLSSVISTTGIGFAFCSGGRLTSVAPPPSHRFAPTSNIVITTAAATTANTMGGMLRVNSRGSLRSPSAAAATAGSQLRALSGRRSSVSVFPGSNHDGSSSSRTNNVTIVSPKDMEDSLLPKTPSLRSVNDVPAAPPRYRADGEEGGSQMRGGARDAAAAIATSSSSANQTHKVGSTPASLTTATAAAVDKSSAFNKATTGNAMRTGQLLSSILQRGGSAASGTLTKTTSLSAVKSVNTDVPQQLSHQQQQQQQQQSPSLPSFPPFGHGQSITLTSVPHNVHSSEPMRFSSHATLLTSTRQDSKSTLPNGGGTGNGMSTSARRLARYRRTRQRHRPALVVARRRGYWAGTAPRSQYSSFMNQRLLCVRINDKYTYIDPRRATGVKKLVADAALLAERQKRAEVKRQSRQEERAERKRRATAAALTAAAAASANKVDSGEPLQQQQLQEKGKHGEVVPGRNYCPHCHRPRRHRHHHADHIGANNSAQNDNVNKAKGNNHSSAVSLATGQSHHRHHHRRTAKSTGTNNNSDLLSQNVSSQWEVHGIAPTPRGHPTSAAIGADERDVNNESIRSGSTLATPQHKQHQHFLLQQQQKQQQLPFGDGLVCFTAQQSPAPKVPNPTRVSPEAITTPALRRSDAAGPTRSNAPLCPVATHDNLSRPQQQQRNTTNAYISRTMGRVTHQHVQSFSSFCSPGGRHSSAPVAATAAAVTGSPIPLSSLQENASHVAAAGGQLRCSSGNGDPCEVMERYEQSVPGATARMPRSQKSNGNMNNKDMVSGNLEGSPCPSMTHQQGDSTLLSVCVSGDHFVAVASTHTSDEVDDRHSESSLSRLPPSNSSSLFPRGVQDADHKEAAMGTAVGAIFEEGSELKRQSTGSSSHIRSSGFNMFTRPTHRPEDRAGLATVGSMSSPETTEVSYFVSPHSLQPHLFYSGRSSSLLSTPPLTQPTSSTTNNNILNNSSSRIVEAPSSTTAEVATESQLSNLAVQRFTTSPTLVVPSGASRTQLSARYAIPSRSTSQSGMLMQDTSGIPYLFQERQERERSRRLHSRSHRSRSARHHSSPPSSSRYASRHHHRGPSSTSSPPDSDVVEMDLLNTALAAYPEFVARPDPRVQPRRQQP